MNIFYKRHLALFCFIFAAASLCGCFLDYKLKSCILISLAIFCLLILIISIIAKKHRGIIFKSAICILFVAFALTVQLLGINNPSRKIEKFIDKSVHITALVNSVNISEDFISVYNVKIETVSDDKINCNAILECEYDAELEVGERIEGTFTVGSIDSYTDTSSYYKAKNICIYLHTPKNITSTPADENLSVKFSKMNQSLSNIITNQINGDEGDFVSALLLGNKDLLDDSISRDFRRLGLSHVLAISGMHLSILMFFADYIFKKLKIGKAVRGGIVVASALFYLALTGFAISTVRAFIMSAIVYLSFIAQDDNDMLTTLLFSLFIILTISPHSVYDIGLWLSFLAVLGIFVAQYFIQSLSNYLYSKIAKDSNTDKYKIKRRLIPFTPKKIKAIVYIFSSVMITLFANIFICVPAWLFFDEISLISVVSNLIVSPVITLILYLSPIFIATSFMLPLYVLLGKIIEKIVGFLLSLVSLMSYLPNITVSLNYPFVNIITIFVAVVLFLCLVLKFKRKWIIIIPPLLASIVFCGIINVDNKFYNNIVQIDYIGGKESEMLLLRDGRNYSIVDISSGGSSHSNNAYILSLKNCATEISSYIITHYHNYHISSTQKILKKAVVRKLYLPYPQNIDEYYIMSSLITVAYGEKADVILYDANGETYISDNLELVLSPRYYLKRSTHPTFYLTLKSRDKYFSYFTESVFESVQNKEELYNTIEKSDFVLLGAHGPKSKTDGISLIDSESKSIIFANEEVKSAFDINSSDFKKILSNIEYCRIYISQK